MRWEFYIDESGNAGDINPKMIDEKLKIEQPIFVIAGFGYPSDIKENINDFIKSIKKKYNIPDDELKAKSLYRSKSDAIADIVKYFYDKELPVFIEVIDKHYFIACKIVDLIFLNMRKRGMHPLRVYHLSRSVSDFICHEFDEALLAEFAQLCIERKPDMLRQWFAKALSFLKRHKSSNAEWLWFILKEVDESYEARAQIQEDAHERYLPEADRSQRGEIIALLPHIPSIVSVLQRIVRFVTDKGATDYRIVHDEQEQFKNILLENIKYLQEPAIRKAMTEFLSVDDIPIRRSLTIPDNLTVEFGNSIDELGIQIADMLAGTLMRIWSEFVIGKVEKGSGYFGILRDYLIPYESLHPSFGICFVVPQYDLDFFYKTLSEKR